MDTYPGTIAEPTDIVIPTEDPAAALQFCRTLAALMQSSVSLPLASVPTLNLEVALVQGIEPDHGQEHFVQVAPQGTQPTVLTSFASPPEFSVVLPVFNEEANLSVLCERLTAVMQEQGADYELIFVDDGSEDNSLEQLRTLAAQDHHIVIFELARNFGHQVAISAGLDHAQGNAVIVMDADLQDPPEELPRFIAKWREGYDVVYAIREHRKESWVKRTAYAAFYRLLQRAANIEIPLDAGDFCIMDRKVVDLLRSMPERNRFVRGIRSWIGLRQTGLPYDRQARHAGRPKYTLGCLMLLALDGLISFSHTPLRLASLLGVSISFLSFLLAGFYFLKKLSTGLSPPGFATLVVSIFFLAGIQLITIGVMGEYIGRVFDEVKQRPLYVVRQVTGGRF